MSASAVALPQPTPAQLARGMAGAVPAELSKSPLLGILGVIIGAGVVTLTSRLISLGLPDLRSHRGFGYDESAWIGSAFDVGLMFIGPFTVYLGSLISPRRIPSRSLGALEFMMASAPNTAPLLLWLAPSLLALLLYGLDTFPSRLLSTLLSLTER